MASRTLDPPLPPAVEALLTALAAALKASEESLQDARAELAPRIACIGRMEEERRALQSANLAANKRIVELEQERDAAKRQISALENQLVNAAALRIEDEAHCERLIAERDAARAELARLTTPRPIAEAPTDKPVLGIWIDHRGNKCVEVLRWGGRWMGALGTPLYREAEYLPMPEVKP